MTFFIWMLAGLILACFLCLYRIGAGPTPPDRTVGIDILGTLLVGFCCVFGILTGQDFYLTIAIVWSLIGFIGTITLAKYLEGRHFDE